MAVATAKKKLSELKALLNDPAFDPNDVVDDETGLTLADLRKGLKENQAQYSRISTKAAELEKGIAARDQQIQQIQGQLQQLDQYRQQLEAKGEAARGPEWRQDPLFAPLAQEFDRITGIAQQLAKAYVGMVQQYATDRESLFTYINTLEVDRMKSRYADFDEDKVREVAKRYKVDSWETAYTLWDAANMPGKIKAAEDKAREDATKSAQEKLKETVTESGGGPVLTAPVGEGDKQVEYDDAWKLLVPEMQKLGAG